MNAFERRSRRIAIQESYSPDLGPATPALPVGLRPTGNRGNRGVSGGNRPRFCRAPYSRIVASFASTSSTMADGTLSSLRP